MPKPGLSDTSPLTEKIVKVDETKAIKYKIVEEVIDITQVKANLKYAQDKLATIPDAPTDAQLLEWAKQNYNDIDYSVEKAALEKMVATNTAILEGIK